MYSAWESSGCAAGLRGLGAAADGGGAGCAKGSASLRWRGGWRYTASRSAVGRGSWSSLAYMDCVKRHVRAVGAKLDRGQWAELEVALKLGPEAFGYASGLWTARRVRDLVEHQTGVRYHEDHVWHILRKLNWSCQRPTGRAVERNEEGIRQWKKYRWPQIKKKPCAKGARSSSSTKAD